MIRKVLTFAIVLSAVDASAQSRLTGYVSAFVDVFPNATDGAGSDRPATKELRVRAFAEQKLAPADRIRFNLAGFAEGLVARRGGAPVEEAIFRVHDASVEVTAGKFDLLAGYTRVAWGRLDELQPSDVINQIDVSRFFFEGRHEARLPVALVRGRFFATDDMTLEAVYVPVFRRGRFDELREATSPFNVARAAAGAIDREPRRSFSDGGQGGVRFSATTGRVDWSVSAYRGFEPFGLYTITPYFGPLATPSPGDVTTPPPGTPIPVVERWFPRFTMIGADFEAARGEWGVRGELALFVDDSFQDVARFTSGSSFDLGTGVDRKAGAYRVGATVLLHRESYDVPVKVDGGLEAGRTDVSLIASADRSFAREKYNLRSFAVYETTEQSAFLRTIGTAKLTDDLALEGSIGWFIGSGRAVIGRFGDSDFAYARLKWYF